MFFVGRVNYNSLSQKFLNAPGMGMHVSHNLVVQVRAAQACAMNWPASPTIHYISIFHHLQKLFINKNLAHPLRGPNPEVALDRVCVTRLIRQEPGRWGSGYYTTLPEKLYTRKDHREQIQGCVQAALCVLRYCGREGAGSRTTTFL